MDSYTFLHTYLKKYILLDILDEIYFSNNFKDIILELYKHPFFILFIDNKLEDFQKVEYKDIDSKIIQKIVLKFDNNDMIEIYSDKKIILNTKYYYNIPLITISFDNISKIDFIKFQAILNMSYKTYSTYIEH